MTSKTSFSAIHKKMQRHDFNQILMQSYGLAIIALILFLFLIPFTTAGLPGRSIFNIDHTHDQLKFRFYLPEAAPAINIAAAAFGMVAGLVLFRFLMDKKSAATYFSLGLSRKNLYINRWLLGCLYILVGIGLPMLLSLFLNTTALGVTSGLFSYFFFDLTGFWLLALISFSMAALCCCLGGTLTEAFLYTASLLLALTVLFGGVGALMENLLWGNAYGAHTYSGTEAILPGPLWQLSFLNPVLFFWDLSAEFVQYYRGHDAMVPEAPPWLLLLCWGVAGIVLTLFAGRAMRARKAEHAGISGANPVFLLTVIFLVCFSAGVALLCFLTDYSLLLGYVAAAVLFIICFVFLNVVLFRWHLTTTGVLWGLLVEVAIAACVVALVASGGLGYTGCVPETAEIKTASLSYVGTPSYLYGDIVGSSTGNGYYFMNDYVYENEDDIQKVTEIHMALSEMGKQSLKTGETASDTVLPYDIRVQYQMKDGQILTRYYDCASLGIFTEMLGLDKGVGVKENIRTTLLGAEDYQPESANARNCYQYGEIWLSDTYYYNPASVDLDDAGREDLLRAIAADVEGQSLQDRYFPTTPALGVIMFSLDSANDSQTFAYKMTNTLVYVTESFPQTLQWLDDKDLLRHFEFEGEIESITLQAYDPYEGINKRSSPMSNYYMAYKGSEDDGFLVQSDFGRKRPVMDPERIEEYVSLLQNGYFMNDKGYFVAVKIAGREGAVYKYLPEELVPDSLSQAAGTERG